MRDGKGKDAGWNDTTVPAATSTPTPRISHTATALPTPTATAAHMAMAAAPNIAATVTTGTSLPTVRIACNGTCKSV